MASLKCKSYIRRIFQNVVDEAIKENNLFSFVCEEPNKEIRKVLKQINLKQCVFWKATKGSSKITVAPKDIHDKIFG